MGRLAGTGPPMTSRMEQASLQIPLHAAARHRRRLAARCRRSASRSPGDGRGRPPAMGLAPPAPGRGRGVRGVTVAAALTAGGHLGAAATARRAGKHHAGPRDAGHVRAPASLRHGRDHGAHAGGPSGGARATGEVLRPRPHWGAATRRSLARTSARRRCLAGMRLAGAPAALRWADDRGAGWGPIAGTSACGRAGWMRSWRSARAAPRWPWPSSTGLSRCTSRGFQERRWRRPAGRAWPAWSRAEGLRARHDRRGNAGRRSRHPGAGICPACG